MCYKDLLPITKLNKKSFPTKDLKTTVAKVINYYKKILKMEPI